MIRSGDRSPKALKALNVLLLKKLAQRREVYHNAQLLRGVRIVQRLSLLQKITILVFSLTRAHGDPGAMVNCAHLEDAEQKAKVKCAQ